MSENKNAKTPTDDGHVAHVYLFEKTGRPKVLWDNAKDIKLGDKLYVAPKQWVGLTDEDRKSFYKNAYAISDDELIERVEAKLKEKNHG